MKPSRRCSRISFLANAIMVTPTTWMMAVKPLPSSWIYIYIYRVVATQVVVGVVADLLDSKVGVSFGHGGASGATRHNTQPSAFGGAVDVVPKLQEHGAAVRYERARGLVPAEALGCEVLV